MGQSVSPVTSRAGHAQMWEFGQATSHESLYYNNNIKLNRLVTKLIQLFFIFGLSCNFNFWWHFGGSTVLNLTSGFSVFRNGGNRASSFSKYYKILSTKRSDFCNAATATPLLLNSGSFKPALSRVLSWENESTQPIYFSAGDDIFFTRVTLLVYRSWVLCS
jgi:hypothetical protein